MIVPSLQAHSPSKAWRRRASVLLRILFFGASIAFLIHFASGLANTNGLHGLRPDTYLAIGIAVILISLTSVVSAVAWNILLAGLSCRVAIVPSTAVYLSTQIAKYLPGNVGHYVGRVALARTRLKVPAAPAVLSLLQEAGLACAGALFIGLGLYCLLPDGTLHGMSRADSYAAFLLFAILLIGAVLVAGLLRKRPKLHRTIIRKFVDVVPALYPSLWSLPFYIAGYVLVGIAAGVIAASLVPLRIQDWGVICGAYSLAWIIGFLIPGAPGGLGVRESALVLLLAGTFPRDVVLLIALLARLASVGADVLAFIVGLLLMCKVRPDPNFSDIAK